MSVEEAADCLLDFFKKPYHLCDFRSIEKIFYFAKPDAVSDLIYEAIE